MSPRQAQISIGKLIGKLVRVETIHFTDSAKYSPHCVTILQDPKLATIKEGRFDLSHYLVYLESKYSNMIFNLVFILQILITTTLCSDYIVRSYNNDLTSYFNKCLGEKVVDYRYDYSKTGMLLIKPKASRELDLSGRDRLLKECANNITVTGNFGLTSDYQRDNDSGSSIEDIDPKYKVLNVGPQTDYADMEISGWHDDDCNGDQYFTHDGPSIGNCLEGGKISVASMRMQNDDLTSYAVTLYPHHDCKSNGHH